ncbi:hypothetical protein ACHAXS_006424 [Conticribra weissflogii]
MGIAMFVSSVVNNKLLSEIWLTSTYPKNQPLAYWVFKQRGQYRIYMKGELSNDIKQSSHMTPDRIRALDEIGFEWNPPRRTK